MTEKIRQDGLRKSAQQLKKLVKMKGSLQGAFALLPSDDAPYFFLQTAPTRTGAASKVVPRLKGLAGTDKLFCGTVHFSDGQLSFELGRLGGERSERKPRALQRHFRTIGKGGLSVLKGASIRVGASEDGTTEDSEAEAIAGGAIAADALSALEAVELDEADQQEIAAYLEATSEIIVRMDALMLPESSPLDGAISLASMVEEISTQRRKEMLAQARAAIGDSSALQQKILALVKKDYSAASVWDAWTLASKLIRAHVPEGVGRRLYRAELMDRLEQADCRYMVEAVYVLGLGLEDYGLPLNHGLIRLPDLGDNVTIERGSKTKLTERRSNTTTHTISYVQLANLLGAALQAGAGSLVTTFQFVYPTKPEKLYLYRGYVQDCWSYVIDVVQMAGMAPPQAQHENDAAAALRWKEDTIAGKLMQALGLIGDKT